MAKQLIISEAQIDEWKADHAKVLKQIESLQASAASIVKRIDAALFLLAGGADTTSSEDPAAAATGPKMTLQEGIRFVLLHDQGSLSQSEIRRRLERLGIGVKHVNYFYTTISRMLKRELIVRDAQSNIALTEKGVRGEQQHSVASLSH